MTRSDKEKAISELSQKLAKAKILILAEYRGLNVSQMTEIRKALRKNEGELKIVKNRLARRAVLESGEGRFSSIEGSFKGPLAMAITEKDPVVLSKVLFKFLETHEALKIKAACLDGRLLSSKEVEALAKLPSKEELYAKMLGTLQAPAQGLVRTLQGVPQKLAMVLKAIAEKK